MFEFEVGWLVNSVCCTWNIFDFVCCVQPESAVSNMCWALMGAHTHYTCTKRMNQPSNTYVLCVLCTYSYEGMAIKGFCFGLYKCQLLISVIKAALCRLCPRFTLLVSILLLTAQSTSLPCQTYFSKKHCFELSNGKHSYL